MIKRDQYATIGKKRRLQLLFHVDFDFTTDFLSTHWSKL